MKRTFMATVVISAVLFSASLLPAIPLKAPPQLLEQAIGLFPEQGGPFELQYRSDLRMHELGFEIATYTFLSQGSEAGYVTRVTSLVPPDADQYFDLLLRLDDKRQIAGSVNLVRPSARDASGSPSSEEAPQAASDLQVGAVLQYLQGKDARLYRDALTVLVNGLAGGANLRDAEPLPAPPKDFVLDTTGKILLPGAPLPLIRTRDLQGRHFSTEQMKGKLIMVFTAPSCAAPCDDLIQALETGLDLSGKRGLVELVHIVGSEAAEAGAYLSRLKAGGTGIAEPDDALSKALKAPFRPYVLMFEDGELKFNFVWENDESKLFGLLYLLIEGTEPEGEDA